MTRGTSFSRGGAGRISARRLQSMSRWIGRNFSSRNFDEVLVLAAKLRGEFSSVVGHKNRIHFFHEECE